MDVIEQFAKRYHLPVEFVATAKKWYLPVAEKLAAATPGKPVLLGIHGCQGSGKSTLSDLLLELFNRQLNVPAVGMSIDDFYLTRKARQKLSKTVHPLFLTRGVPGTHDVRLLSDVIDRLMNFSSTVAVPVFNKAIDDRLPESEWRMVDKAPAIVILEGWCVGATPQEASELLKPCNQFEAEEDQTGRWRAYANESLNTGYQHIFNRIDYLLMLKAPEFSAVQSWRLEQEERLRAKLVAEGKDVHALMDKPAVIRFIQHYQRLTEHCLQTLPAIADEIFYLNLARSVVSHTINKSND